MSSVKSPFVLSYVSKVKPFKPGTSSLFSVPYHFILTFFTFFLIIFTYKLYIRFYRNLFLYVLEYIFAPTVTQVNLYTNVIRGKFKIR